MAGESGSGKSLFLLHLMCQTLLPRLWHGVELGGCGAGVVVIDTDLRFNIMQISLMMETTLKKKIKQATIEISKKKKKSDDENNAGKSPTCVYDKRELTKLVRLGKKALTEAIKTFVQSLLKNLIYLKCYHSEQFVVTLLTIDHVLASQQSVSLVCIDSVSAYYWHDRTYVVDSWKSAEQHYNKIFSVFFSHLRKAGVVVVGVRQLLYNASKSDKGLCETESNDVYNFLGKEWYANVKYFVSLKSIDQNHGESSESKELKPIYELNVSCEGSSKQARVTYGASGFNVCNI